MNSGSIFKYTLFSLLLLGVIEFSLVSCTRKIYVPMEYKTTEIITRRDTCVLTQLEVFHDTIVSKDTVSFLSNKYAESWARWSDGKLHHSLQTKNDSVKVKIQYLEKEKKIEIPVPYPVEVIKNIEKPFTRWQRIKLFLGEIFMGILILGVVWKAVRIRKNRFL